MNKDPFQRRTVVVQLFVLLAFGALVAKLFHMQVIDDRYAGLAQDNVIDKRRVTPPRGLIHDRTGRLLVYNEPIFDLHVTPSLAQGTDTARLCEMLGIDRDEFQERMDRCRSFSSVKPSAFYRQLSEREYAAFQEFLFLFPGFTAKARTVRHYTIDGAAHVLGDVGEIDPGELSANEGYRSGDFIGKSGIEKVYEDLLKGRTGVKHVLVDVHNRVVGRFNDGEMDTLPVAGRDLQLTIDADLQLYGERLMQNKVGSIVAIEPATGEVLALVSSPGYDPNLLYGRKRGENYEMLAADSLSPLFNRAIMAQYPPGSTFKPLVALIGMAEGGIKPTKSYVCNGVYYIPGYALKCSHAHAPSRNVQDAIMHSCNPYFWETFRSTIDQDRYGSVHDGFERWTELAANFGLGEPLGIDMPGERGGNLPTADDYDQLYSAGAWGSSTILSLGIGQGELLVTPLQLAHLYAILANRGTSHVPHLLRAVEDSMTLVPDESIDMPVDREFFDIVAEGLRAVVRSGTARRSRIEGIDFCGKTGTAQNPHGEDHSIFAGFAPLDTPAIAVAVVVENAGGGSAFAAPIASLMTEYYLHDSIARSRRWFEQTILETDLIHIEKEADDDAL